MCKSMTDFETLVQTIQAQKEERDFACQRPDYRPSRPMIYTRLNR